MNPNLFLSLSLFRRSFTFASIFSAASPTNHSFARLDSCSTSRLRRFALAPLVSLKLRSSRIASRPISLLPFSALHDALSHLPWKGCKWTCKPYARAGWPSAERRRQPISTRPIPFKPLPCPPATPGPTSRQSCSRLSPPSTLPDSQPTDAPHHRPAPGTPARHLARSTPDVDLAQGRPTDARRRGQALGRDAADADGGGLPVQQGVSPSFVLLRRTDGELGRSERG
jgi:hypothetical protein